MSLMGPFVLRTFDAGKGQAAKDRQLAAGSPVHAILGTNSDEPIDITSMILILVHIPANTMKGGRG